MSKHIIYTHTHNACFIFMSWVINTRHAENNEKKEQKIQDKSPHNIHNFTTKRIDPCDNQPVNLIYLFNVKCTHLHPLYISLFKLFVMTLMNCFECVSIIVGVILTPINFKILLEYYLKKNKQQFQVLLSLCKCHLKKKLQESSDVNRWQRLLHVITHFFSTWKI